MLEESGQLLSSWKEISVYLGRTIRTCQRLEVGMGLPVHRLDGSPKAHVFAYAHELDAWLAQKVDEHQQVHKRPRRLALYAAAVLAGVVAVAALAVVVLSPRSDARSVAVLPFDDLSPKPGSEHFAAGITEGLTDGLARIHGLRVTGKISASAVKDRKLDAREAGAVLKVRSFVEGNVQVAGGRLRVTARLVNARTRFVRWTETYDGPIEDFFDVKDGITKAVVDRLGIILSAGETSALVKRPTSDMQAYELYLTGRYHLGRPRPEAPGLALRFFDEALRRDPKFALAKVGIAGVHLNMLSLLVARANDAGPKAEAAVREALAMEPDLAEAHAFNAWLQFIYKWDWAAAEREFLLALELKPGDALTRGWYAFFLFCRRRFDEARVEIKRALAADPLTPYLYGYSMWIHIYTDGTDEALKDFKKVQQIEPDYSFAYFGAGLAYWIQGRIDESLEMFKKASLMPGTRGWPEAGLVAAYIKKGDRKSAGDVYSKLVRRLEDGGGVSPVHVAWAAAAMGDIDRAAGLMETAVQEHDPPLLNVHITAELLLPQLVRDPRFLAILDKVGLPR